MKDIIKGKVFAVGNDINTDVIIPARYLNTMDPEELKLHAMEDLDPEEYPISFLNEDGTCDYQVIIAGTNFGCGSSREHAPIALAGAGVEAVVASSFARIYYRNSVNGGIILPLESSLDLNDPRFIRTGDQVEIDLSKKMVRVDPTDVYDGLNRHPKMTDGLPIKDFGPVKNIIEAGGLTKYNKKRLGL